jgi:hypothetical protein
VQLSHSPIVDVLAPAHGIGEMNFPVIAIVDIRQGSGNPSLGHHSVRLAQERFANEANSNSSCRGFYRGPQASTTGSNDKHIVFESFVIAHNA